MNKTKEQENTKQDIEKLASITMGVSMAYIMKENEIKARAEEAYVIAMKTAKEKDVPIHRDLFINSFIGFYMKDFSETYLKSKTAINADI